jgi:hypothetical protein
MGVELLGLAKGSTQTTTRFLHWHAIRTHLAAVT